MALKGSWGKGGPTRCEWLVFLSRLEMYVLARLGTLLLGNPVTANNRVQAAAGPTLDKSGGLRRSDWTALFGDDAIGPLH
jgi:hypothetical protein